MSPMVPQFWLPVGFFLQFYTIVTKSLQSIICKKGPSGALLVCDPYFEAWFRYVQNAGLPSVITIFT